MNQLIINGILMPEVSKNKYKAEEVPLTVMIEMIDGSIAIEERGKVWTISSSYNYLYDRGGTILPRVLATLRGGRPFLATFLPDNGLEMLTSSFVATSVTSPSMSFSAGGVPYWTGLAFTLREEYPHD